MTLQLQNMLRLKMGWAKPAGRYHEVVLSSRIRLARNIARYPFPARLGPRGFAAVLDAAFEAAKRTRLLGKAAYLQLEDVEPLERVFLAERHLVSRDLVEQPKNRGVIVGEREVLSAMVNEEDHFRLQAIDSGLCLDELWLQAVAMEDELSRSLEFAYDPQWGFLTACPTNTGTAVRVSALLHMPGLSLTGEINQILHGLSRAGLVARGLYGEGTRVLGDFYQISNAISLGRSEEDLLRAVSRSVEHLVDRETDAQRRMAEGHKTRLEDLAYRSLGALSQARSITFEETMQHLSHLRVALALGWRMPVDLETLNELMILAQPAHVMLSAGKELEAAERDALRASLLRKRVKLA